jgi:LuxR family transcriptional regulator, maltose regulon positive regulatory protein
MDNMAVSERSGQPRDDVGAVFDLLASKLRRPQIRPETVRRASLVEQLVREDSGPIVSVVAPAGYGKTTLLAQWAEHSGQAVAWVSVDERDNDPKLLLAYVAKALDTVQPVGRPVFDALASPASSVPGSVVPRLGYAFSVMAVPVLLILDDVHLLHARACRDALSVLADHVPATGRLVLAGRGEPPLRVARLRAEGRITEIGPRDLALTREEAGLLLRNAEVTLGEGDLADLYQRTEGWAVGLYLAALYLRDGGSLPHTEASFSGSDQFVSEYVESELLARISRQRRMFLTRAAVLERMCGPLCEATLDLPGSAAALAALAQSNMLLVPLDHRREWYRYHHLFRDMLQAELERREPGLTPVLRRRAAAWCERNGLPEEALEYSIAGEDVDTAARLVEQLAVPARRKGRVATLQRWFEWLEDRQGIERHPMVTVLAALIYAWMGQPGQADRWADAVDGWQDGHPVRPHDPAADGWAALLRAFMCRCGVDRMRADADEASRRFAAQGTVTAGPALLQGLAHVLSGDLDEGDAYLAEAVRIGETTGAHEILAAALSERSLLAMACGDWGMAQALAGQAGAALRLAGIEASYVTPLVCAAQARAALHQGDIPGARQQLVSAQRMRPMQTYAIPHVAVQSRIELTRAHLMLSDLAGARTIMQEIDQILRRRPQLGILVSKARKLRTRLVTERGPITSGASALTTAELRVLPLLATHLSYLGIADELFVSSHTIKSQAYSLYRKLGASSRSQAVARARELGMLEG